MIYKTAETLVCDHFNEDYFNLHQHLMSTGDQTGSRNGSTKEILNFKTVIKNPIKRCVGGNNRNINIFFLLAEAIWIWSGRRDVAFLDTFNSRLKDYSDDGINYHAPYGWRLRNWGIDSMQKFDETNLHSRQGLDQIQSVVHMLSSNPEDRRVVTSIWNPDLDLQKKSTDLPCNDMLMYKVRNGKLYSTIANRSNDLNLGLTTNVFQFSFISEIVSKILNIGLGDQVHNSQSLHLYLNHSMTYELFNEINESKNNNHLYSSAKAIMMDFSFTDSHTPIDKLKLVDFHINSVLLMISQNIAHRNQETIDVSYEESLKSFSRYFYYIYKLLMVYVEYKVDSNKLNALNKINSIGEELPEFIDSDYHVLALNFFAQRILKENKDSRAIIEIREMRNKKMYTHLSTY